MTDTSLYTGSHKHRFDEEGKGKGLEGRDSIAKGKGMVPGSVSSQQAYVSGYKGDGKYTSSPKSSPKPKAKVESTCFNVVCSQCSVCVCVCVCVCVWVGG